MPDLLLPVYLFVVYLAIVCWLRTPIKSVAVEPKVKSLIKSTLLPSQIREIFTLDLGEPETLNPKLTRPSRSKRTIKDVIQTAAAA